MSANPQHRVIATLALTSFDPSPGLGTYFQFTASCIIMDNTDDGIPQEFTVNAVVPFTMRNSEVRDQILQAIVGFVGGSLSPTATIVKDDIFLIGLPST